MPKTSSDNTERASENMFLYFPPERYGVWATTYAAAAGAPLRIVQRNWRREFPLMLLLFFIIVIFYAVTTPSTVALEDDALFISNLHFWGVAHPPGYPAHTLLGGIFYHLLPLGNEAFRAHFFSGFAGAGAGIALYAVVAMLVYGRLFPVLAALAYACSKTFWSQAVIAEVYTLNACVFFTLLALAIAYAGHRHPPQRLLFAMAIVTGIGLANHYPLLLLGGVGIALLVLPRTPNKFIMLPVAAAVSLLTALPFYLWMIWRSYQQIPANFYGEPLSTFEQFSFYILRKGYSGVDQQSDVDFSDKLIFAEHFAGDLLWQFTPLGFALAAAGFLLMARSRYNWLWLCLFISFLCNSVLLLLLLNFQVGFIALAVFRVYYLLAFGIIAIWLALGGAWCADLLRRYPIIWRRLAGALLLLSVTGATVAVHWRENNRSDYTWAEDLVMAKLDSVEANAVLFLHDDLDVPAIYLHHIKGARPDLEVYSDQGLILPNRLFSPLLPEYPPAENPRAPSRIAHIHRFIARETSPIYYNSVRYKIFTTQQNGSEFLGFYRRVNRRGPDNPVNLHNSAKEWLKKNLDGSLTVNDPWTRFQQYETISSVMNAVVQAAEEGTLELTGEWREIIDIARAKNAKVRILTDFIRLDSLTEEERATEAQWLETFNFEEEHLMDKFGRGRLYLLKARLAELNHGKTDPLYEAGLKQALAEDKRLSNPGLQWLLDYYSEDDSRFCDYMALINQYYPDVNIIPAARLSQLRQIRKQAVCT